ncbi:GFA family protein [Bradyrhizobium sp. GCM10027634]|uniref:GFA family protein n=1 Tax=unclassified Bradyrhizobium TaxID=2631580 RepID=UPI00263AEAAE|nr:GFA family protein [Bradyrhizobium sp. WYCCWR 12677]MDN5005489.1 GFA family protein [Bradyrhizobium sp. WYCCWR 12677]
MSVLSGGCACGAVRYELADEPIFQLICHCADCRRASGSEFAKVLFAAADRLSMLGSELKLFPVRASSGRTMNRGFCENCGSLVTINRPEIPQIEFLQAGSLDDPSLFTPATEVFTCRADLLITSIESIGRLKEGPPIELFRDVVAAHFAKRH